MNQELVVNIVVISSSTYQTEWNQYTGVPLALYEKHKEPKTLNTSLSQWAGSKISESMQVSENKLYQGTEIKDKTLLLMQKRKFDWQRILQQALH